MLAGKQSEGVCVTEEKKRNRKSFDALKSQDFTIRDDNGLVGHLRVKPNGIAWKAKSQRTYKQISIEAFAEFADREGRTVKN